MPMYIVGGLHLANGAGPALFLEASATATVDVVPTGPTPFGWRCTFLGGHLTLELRDVSEGGQLPIGEVFRVRRHLIDSAIAAEGVKQGLGLVYSIETCRRGDGQVFVAPYDVVAGASPLAYDYQAIFSVIGSD